MTGKGKKQEPPLYLDMDFGEALERFAKTDPKEVQESMDRSKTKKTGRARGSPGSKIERKDEDG